MGQLQDFHVASHLLHVALNEAVAEAEGCCGENVCYGWVQ
jgi:hypothetical protein